ncbi:alkaline phosphatase D family protein [Agaribacter flavus]|uniref:Alkaline phosphatase D family protein n=1 Tax=Agaribacter flavus TaxID=1902781 RepID=A0ABV7FS14_9ALTE
MKKNVSRRDALKFVAAGVVSTGVVGCTKQSISTELTQQHSEHDFSSTPLPTKDKWHKTPDRTWLGGEYWANPMEDWQVKNGAAECSSIGGNRSIHSLTHQLKDVSKPFQMSVNIKRLTANKRDGGAGFRLGVKSELNEYRSNCFVQQGYDAGILGDRLILGAKETLLSSNLYNQTLSLELDATPQLGASLIILRAKVGEKVIAELSHLAAKEELIGNVALVSNFAIASVTHQNPPANLQGNRYRFSDWEIAGEAFEYKADRTFGTLLWTMYSLSDSRSSEGFVMKLSAYTGPIGKLDNQYVELQILKGKQWISIAKEKLNTDGWVATFRIPNWNEKQNHRYRAVYVQKYTDNTEEAHYWEGNIKANPSNRPLKMAALTCQNDYGYPYQPVADNVRKLDPDLVFFSGDQLYEQHGGFGIIREPANLAILNYLRKFYQFAWAFREVMRNCPTICLPDDHDVLQGNLWGEGGAPMQNIEKDLSASVLSGYIEPVRVVNTVHRTSTAHHPDPFDPSPTNGISAYYSDMVYGDVGFAILADRQWKSGPDRINVEVGVTGEGEDPLLIRPEYDPEGLELLGKRQEAFLTQWSKDWRGHTLKAVLSQTVFAGISTHQPRPDRYLKYDFDSSGWPASARNRAIDCMRPSMALHICGDTHLGTLSQYGVSKQRDSNWAFCTPAIAAGWPRWWLPDEVGLPHTNRPSHGIEQTGEYLDSFGNKIYVYAVGNPEVGKSGNRYVKAHEKGSGFGFITFDTSALTYTLSAYKFLVDVSDGRASNQFEGWPVTIHQKENRGENILS